MTTELHPLNWEPETRDVPAELEDNYTHEVYPAPAIKFATVADQLDAATKETLMRLAGHASVGEPHA